MDLLTGKAKEDFFKDKTVHLFKNEYIELTEDYFNRLTPFIQNQLIMAWLDDIGYTIDRDSYDTRMVITDWTDGEENQTIVDCDYLNPFNEWFEEAIIKANEIYNSK